MGYVLSNRGSSVKNNINFYIDVICADICYVGILRSGDSFSFNNEAQSCSSSLVVGTLILLVRSNFNVN